MRTFIRLLFGVLLSLTSFHLASQSTTQHATDTTQFNLLYKKAKEIAATKAPEAIKLLKMSLELKDLADICPDCEMKALALQGNVYFRQHQTDSAILIYTKLKNSALANTHLKYLSMSLNNLGSCNNAEGNYTQAISFYKEAIEVKKQINDSSGVARGLFNLGSNLIKFGNFDGGLTYLLEAKDLREKLKDTSGIATALNSIGVLYKKQNDFDNALLYFEDALKMSKLQKNDKVSARLYSSIGTVYEAKKEYTKALDYYEEGLKYSEASNFKFGIALTLLNSGNVLMEMNAFQNAKERLLRGYDIAKEIKREYFITAALHKLGWCYFKQGDILKAIEYTNSAIDKAKESNDLPVLRDAYEKLAIIYESQQKHKAALNLWKEHYVLKDSLFNADNIRNTANIQTKHKIAQEQLKYNNKIALKENELELLEKEEELKTKTIWALSCGILLISVLGFLVWKNQYQKLRLNQNEKTISETKLKNATLEKERMALEVEVKSKELNSFALNILQRIDFIDNLRDTIKSLKGEGSNLGNEKLELIDIKLRETQSFEQDRELFKMKLDQEQDTFLRKMKGKYPRLTKDEIRLAALLKIDFSSKEIATMLNIESKSVDMKRYRLRKKMQLGKEVNLNAFLKSV
ncbi:tetratricopeptide repeat protein [uncultured Winogradskyella sp.]|uniref:tetratricopeptide repeat protein n=1 Tax=uncultured Winogradskyella sp. TaxID=395353 RepID=UPI00261C3599|nr:tetratricopeptide repeat protein [uncultured Winogradskyella sp.]